MINSSTKQINLRLQNFSDNKKPSITSYYYLIICIAIKNRIAIKPHYYIGDDIYVDIKRCLGEKGLQEILTINNYIKNIENPYYRYALKKILDQIENTDKNTIKNLDGSKFPSSNDSFPTLLELAHSECKKYHQLKEIAKINFLSQIFGGNFSAPHLSNNSNTDNPYQGQGKTDIEGKLKCIKQVDLVSVKLPSNTINRLLGSLFYSMENENYAFPPFAHLSPANLAAMCGAIIHRFIPSDLQKDKTEELYSSLLKTACEHKRYDAVNFLLNQNKQAFLFRDKYNNNIALHYACAIPNNEKIMLLLLEQKLKNGESSHEQQLLCRNDFARIPLHLAVIHNHMSNAKLLIEYDKSLSTEQVNVEDNNKRMPIHYACHEKGYPLATYLSDIPGAILDSRDIRDRSITMLYAVIYNEEKEKFLEHLKNKTGYAQLMAIDKVSNKIQWNLKFSFFSFMGIMAVTSIALILLYQFLPKASGLFLIAFIPALVIGLITCICLNIRATQIQKNELQSLDEKKLRETIDTEKTPLLSTKIYDERSVAIEINEKTSKQEVESDDEQEEGSLLRLSK